MFPKARWPTMSPSSISLSHYSRPPDCSLGHVLKLEIHALLVPSNHSTLQVLLGTRARVKICRGRRGHTQLDNESVAFPLFFLPSHNSQRRSGPRLADRSRCIEFPGYAGHTWSHLVTPGNKSCYCEDPTHIKKPIPLVGVRSEKNPRFGP